MVGQARAGLRAEVFGHGLEPPVSRPTRRRSCERTAATGGQIRHAHLPNGFGRVRLFGITSRTQPSSVVCHSLPEREPPTGGHRLRVLRRPDRASCHRMGSPSHHRDGSRTVVQIRHEWSELRMCGQRGTGLRLGSGQGAAGLGSHPATPAHSVGKRRDRRGRRVPSVSGPISCRLPHGVWQHETVRLMVQAWIPIRVYLRRARSHRSVE